MKSRCIGRNVTPNYEYLTYEPANVSVDQSYSSAGLQYKPCSSTELAQTVEKINASPSKQDDTAYDAEKMRRTCSQLLISQNFTMLSRESITAETSNVVAHRDVTGNETLIDNEFLHSTKIGCKNQQRDESNSLQTWSTSPLEANYNKSSATACDRDETLNDFSFNVAGTVEIVNADNKGWLHIKVADDRTEGFVPRSTMIDLEDLLTKLGQYQENVLAQQSCNSESFNDLHGHSI